MRLSTLFTAVLGLSVALFAISLLTGLSYPAAANTPLQGNPDSGVSLDGVSPQPVASPPHCHPIVSREPTTPAPTVTPPWHALLARVSCRTLLCRTPLLRFVVDLLYNELYDKSTTNRKPTASPEQKSTTSCRTISKSYNKLYDLSHSKSTADRSNGVRHLLI